MTTAAHSPGSDFYDPSGAELLLAAVAGLTLLAGVARVAVR